MTAATVSPGLERRIAALKAACPWLMILVKSWRPTAYIGWTRIQAPTVGELLDEIDELLQPPPSSARLDLETSRTG